MSAPRKVLPTISRDLSAARLKHGEPLLYLAGADRSSDIAADLAAQNFVVRTAVVYRAVQADALPAAAAEVLRGGIDGVLHFSPRSAEAYVNATRAAGLSEAVIKNLIHFCLSLGVAQPLTEAGAADIRIAGSRPRRRCSTSFRRLERDLCVLPVSG